MFAEGYNPCYLLKKGLFAYPLQVPFHFLKKSGSKNFSLWGLLRPHDALIISGCNLRLSGVMFAEGYNPCYLLKKGLFAYPLQVPLQYVLSLFLICHSEGKARRISHNRSFAVLRMTQRTPCGGHTTASSQPARPLCRVFCGACGAAKHPHKSVSRVQIVYPLYYLLKKGFSAPGCVTALDYNCPADFTHSYFF